MAEPIMDIRQRALQLWSLLVLAARTQTVLSYGMVSRMTGLPAESGEALTYVASYCLKKKLPLLTSLVVSQETGRPNSDLYSDLEAEHRRCFVQDWLAQGLPTVEALDEAYEMREKLRQEYKASKTGPASA